jgi:hypothetical protein
MIQLEEHDCGCVIEGKLRVQTYRRMVANLVAVTRWDCPPGRANKKGLSHGAIGP